jgi:hypothetical protein
LIVPSAHEQSRDLAWKRGLAATHHRQVIYEAIVASPGHYSPEQIYADVRRGENGHRLPTIRPTVLKRGPGKCDQYRFERSLIHVSAVGIVGKEEIEMGLQHWFGGDGIIAGVDPLNVFVA